MTPESQLARQERQIAALQAELELARGALDLLQQRDEQQAEALRLDRAGAVHLVEIVKGGREGGHRHFDDIHEANCELQRLYDKLQAQQEQLVAVTGELAAQSEELVGQQGELTVLYRELEAQQAELSVLYRELETQLEELHSHNDYLNAEVVKRTQAIVVQLAELRRVNKLLTESDHYKDQFLGVISHELRTPLNFIMGFASVLEDQLQGQLNEGQSRSVGKILEGTERMLGLVDNLLDSSSIQAGRFGISLGTVDCNAMLDEVMAQMQPVARMKGVSLRASCRVAGPVAIDRQRIAQVLINLISNAIKFTPPGGSVTARLALEQGELVAEVVDTGIGVAEADMPLLFTRFKQLDGSPTREAGGTGLGLAISKAIVEAHGGRIGVESRYGHGAKFHFRLPMC